jgi:DNA polymerase III epsilon subunit-like protein
MWYELPHAALDFESSGERAIQVGWSTSKGVDFESELGGAVEEIDPESAKIHKLTLKDLEGKPTMHEVWMDHLRPLTKEVAFFVEYSGFDPMGYDEGLLRKELKLLDRQRAPMIFLDVFDMVKRIEKGERLPRTLDAVCARYECKNRPNHRALADSKALLELFDKIAPMFHKSIGRPSNPREVHYKVRHLKTQHTIQRELFINSKKQQESVKE